MKHLDMKIACGKQPQPTFAFKQKKTPSVTMTNVILIPEKQIILIHPEWSVTSMSSTPFLPPTHMGWCLKSYFSHSLCRKY